MNYEEHEDVLKSLKRDQEAEEDLRQEVDEIIHFLNHPQGQWEPAVWNDFDGRPRYTFDQCNPAIAKVWAEMAANEYAASVQPVGGGASEDVSNIIDGLLRNIYNISSFDDTSTKAGKRMIAAAFGAWRVVSQYASSSCFYQDIMILPVNNAHRRVWFDCDSELQTREDAMHVHYLSNVGAKKGEKLAGRPVASLADNRSSDSYQYKPSDTVIIGEILYKKAIKKTIYLLDDDEGSVVDDVGLKAMGLTKDSEEVIASREADDFRVYSRKYDNEGFIGKAKETAFSFLPIIPCYANFDISEDGKVTYRGLVRGVMDHQRVFNYAESRKVEESVLQPRRKLFMDDRLTEGYEDEIENLNRDPRAVQQFNGKNADMVKIPFFETQGPAPNTAVSEISNDMIRNFQLTLGLPNELEIAASTSRDSDYRFNQRSSIGQVGTFEYYRGLKVALEHTAKVIIDAIPRVYDTERKIRVIDEANQSSEVTINQKDRATGKVLYDLTVGKYDVCIDISENFETRQAKANSAIMEVGKINPEVIMRNTDIIANNTKAPGMRTVADRERQHLFAQGIIPESQWTDEEKEKMAMQQQQPKDPDPGTLIAQAELQKAQAETDRVQIQLLMDQTKLEQAQLKIQADAMAKDVELRIKEQSAEIDNLKKLIEANKILAEIEAMGNGQDSQEMNAQEQLINNMQAQI